MERVSQWFFVSIMQQQESWPRFRTQCRCRLVRKAAWVFQNHHKRAAAHLHVLVKIVQARDVRGAVGHDEVRAAAGKVADDLGRRCRTCDVALPSTQTCCNISMRAREGKFDTLGMRCLRGTIILLMRMLHRATIVLCACTACAAQACGTTLHCSNQLAPLVAKQWPPTLCTTSTRDSRNSNLGTPEW